MAKGETSKRVTADDLQNKWQELETALKVKTQKKTLGITHLSLGLLAVGVGAVGVAFWLGRRSARSQPVAGASVASCSDVAAVSAHPSLPSEGAQSPRLAQILEPVMDIVVRSAMTAITDKLKHKVEAEIQS